MDWDSAYQYCTKTMHSNLIAIKSKEAQDALKFYLRSLGKYSVVLSGTLAVLIVPPPDRVRA